ncbi:synaptogenesis protein syg-2-like [Ruditapes philippinarum]|uniref:synaptogenesis protein syg-2-like n=1 Tax=Ruditapes philippinarum TaxID=129788 RepID=UPI00295B8E0C|nr:synaptogenesis protein syg-2-like [Ruditapes philippinarum]
MREYQPQLSTCTTSACRPTPTVKWYIRHFKENITVDMTAHHSKQRYNQHDNGLVSSESILEFLPNRTINNWTLFCEVRTQMEYADISSKEIVLNVSYPPESPPFIHGFTNDTVPRVVESEPNTLSCSVTGGNPLATLTLTCFNTRSTTLVITNRTVTATITWKAKRNQNNCTCESNHIISGKEITNVKFEVLFPPDKVHFTISGQEPEGATYAVNNKEDVSLICFTESNPNPDIIVTNAKNERLVLLKNTTILRHTLQKVSCVDAGEYECSARNDVTTGHEAKSTLILIVKCLPKPATDSLKESIIAVIPYTDVTLQFIAKNYFDEQNKTQFTWYKQNTSLHYDSSKYMILSYGLQSVLIIRNVTQSDYGQYRVVVRNSVGQYIHYFELHMREQESSVDSSTNMGTTIGVAVGTFVFTILCIVLAFVGYKYIRRKRNLQHQHGGTPATGNAPESQTTPTYDYINPSTDSKNVYQELGDTSEEGHAYMEMRSANTDDSTLNYINMTL